MQSFSDIISGYFDPELALLVVSMVPFVELRGGVILGAALGFHWLENEHEIIEKSGQRLAIVGITDPMAKRYDRQEPALNQALRGIPQDATIILLSHQVKQSNIYAQFPIDLQLSGHTHGGQIWGLHWLAQRLNNGFVKGLYRLGEMQLYINRGTSLWFGFPIRLGIESEISLITLKQAHK